MTAGPIAGSSLQPEGRHRSRLARQDLLRLQHAGPHRADAEQLVTGEHRVPSVGATLAPELRCGPVREGTCRFGLERDARHRQQRSDRENGVRQPPLAGECLEPLGRDRVVGVQAGGLRATQRRKVATAAETIAKVAGQRPHVGSRVAAQVDPQGGAVGVPR